jgi:hypothetical protein
VNRKVLSFLFLATIFFIKVSAQQQAVVISPIANLSLRPLQRTYKEKDIASVYDALAIASVGEISLCRRVHQLLFNETVTVVKEQEQEVLIEISSLYPAISCNNPHVSTKSYWIPKKHLKFLTAEDFKNSHFPKSIDTKNPYDETTHRQTVALLLPIYDPVTQKTYSAGTRFIYTKKQTSQNYWFVYVYDSNDNREKIITLPSSICIAPNILKTTEEKIKMFVELLKVWTYKDIKEKIPFVWGGCSIRDFCIPENFNITKFNATSAIQIKAYEREENSIPYSGLDSSGLILRAAQICGIPYFCKNSTTCRKHLRPLKENEAVEKGDIIWLPRYICAISSVENNKVVCARGYDPGFGFVDESDLSDLFAQVSTYEQLLEYHTSEKPILVKRRDGSTKQFGQVVILKLSSCWDN